VVQEGDGGGPLARCDASRLDTRVEGFDELEELARGGGKIEVLVERRIPLVEIAGDDGQPVRLSVPSGSELAEALKK